jgi:hypothetical protein
MQGQCSNMSKTHILQDIFNIFNFGIIMNVEIKKSVSMYVPCVCCDIRLISTVNYISQDRL